MRITITILITVEHRKGSREQSIPLFWVLYLLIVVMGKVADPSPRKRGKVEALLKIGTMTQREIAEPVGLSQKAVHTTKVRLDITGTSWPERSTSGRKLTVYRNRKILI